MTQVTLLLGIRKDRIRSHAATDEVPAFIMTVPTMPALQTSATIFNDDWQLLR